MCRPRLFLPCHQHRAAIGHPALFPCIGGGRVAARPASRCGDGWRPFAPFLPAPTASLSLASMGCVGTARPLFPVLIGGRADFPSSPRGGGTEGPLRLSSQQRDGETVPPLLAAVGQRGRSASPCGGGTERLFRLSLRQRSRVPSLFSHIDRMELPPFFFSLCDGKAGCGPPLLLTSEGRALSLPPHAGQGLHPHSATPVGPGRALPTPSLCGATPPPQGKGRCLYRVLPQKGGAQRRLAGKKKRWTVGDGQGCPVLSRSPFPLRPSGKRSLLREGAAPAILQSSGAAALCPKPLSSPLQAPSAGHPPPAFYPPFAPSIPQVPCPHMDSAGREKKSPGPHRGGAELF